MRGTTFSERVKEELASVPVEDVLEIKAELSGFLKARGSQSLKSGHMVVSLGSIASARRLIRLVDLLKGKLEREVDVLYRKLDKRKRVTITIAIDPFVDLRWDSDIKPSLLPNYITSDAEIFGCFLRGMFLAGGSMANPRKHYHFEIVTFSGELLEKVSRSSKELFGIEFKVSKLRYNYRLYLKSSKDILEVLHVMGAQRSALEFERIMKERMAKGDANRSYNFISANANRSGESIVKQIEAIKKIDEVYGIDNLPEDLKRVALARLENEDLSLRELGEVLNMTKAMVYSRIRRIMKLAEEISS